MGRKMSDSIAGGRYAIRASETLAGCTGGRDQFLDYVRDDPTETSRYQTLLKTLAGLAHLVRGRHVLDFGSSYGLSTCALIRLGAQRVDGVEPDPQRIKQGGEFLRAAGYQGVATVRHVPDTRCLPFEDESFDVVLANAVFEHIPQPRDDHVREVWRVLRRDGHLVINESPNKYLPKEIHTTGLWFVHWLPSFVARRYAVWRGRFGPSDDWSQSGWRGIGYFEIARRIPGHYELVPESSRLRHRMLSAVGLPASLLDPYPTLVFRKL